MSVFQMEIPVNNKTKMDEFQKVMNEIHNETKNYIQELARQSGFSQACAHDVWYLRSRNRWTQKLEDQLIECHKNGTPVNIMEFGN